MCIIACTHTRPTYNKYVNADNIIDIVRALTLSSDLYIFVPGHTVRSLSAKMRVYDRTLNYNNDRLHNNEYPYTAAAAAAARIVSRRH